MTDAGTGTPDNVRVLRPDTDTLPPKFTEPPPVAPPPADEPGKRRPVVPEHLRPENIKATARQAAGLQAHRTAYHGVRLLPYLFMTCWYALRGGGELWHRLRHWWGAANLSLIESEAVAEGKAGRADALRAHTQGLKTRKARGQIVFLYCLGALFALVVAARLGLLWLWPLAAVAGLVMLARAGKPAGKPLVKAAVVPARYAEPSQDIILDALAGMGVPALAKVATEGGIEFRTPIYRDGPGWCVQFDLPKGVTAVDVIDKRDKLASGLRRPLSAVWPATVPHEHPGRVELWIGFQPLNKQEVGRWALLRGGKVSLFEAVPFGGDQRIRPVSVLLMFASVLIGSKPRMGKTMALRILALACALDPTARIRAWELKGTGDLSCLEPVAHEYGSGADDGTLDACLASVRKVYAELDTRAKTIRELPKEQAPENKVTPVLSAKRSLGLFPEVLIIDECQEAFSDDGRKGEFEKLTTAIAKRGPALGIILMLATQRPDAKSLPTGVASNMGIRFCLRVLGWRENNMILGDGMSAAGYNAVNFAEADKGIGYLTGADGIDDPVVLRTFYIDAPTADKIGLRARALREAAGTLSGYALGVTDDSESRDVLTDVLAVFSQEPGLHWGVVAERLAGRFPDRWAGATADAVSAQCRDLGVPTAQVKMGGRNTSGCRRLDVERAVGK